MEHKLFETFVEFKNICNVMEQYGTENLIVITKVMYTCEHFIMETLVIFYVISLEMSKIMGKIVMHILG